MPHLRHALLAAPIALIAACTDDPTSLRPTRASADVASDIAIVPDTVSAALYDAANVVALGNGDGARTLRGAVLVLFRTQTSDAQRAAAITRVGGTIVGGRRLFGTDGIYVVHVSGDALAAADTLASLSSVAAASPELMGAGGDDWLAPHDDAAVGRWTASPDSNTVDANWAFERVAAPLAWGCARGDWRTPIAIVDRGFTPISDVAVNAMAFPEERVAADETHGTMTSSILAARGDDGVGMAGMMWYADLQLVSRAPTSFPNIASTALAKDAAALATAVLSSARVVTLAGSLAPEPNDASEATRRAPYEAHAVAFLTAVLRRAESESHTQPLYVFSAGNVHGDGPNVDPRWNTYPALRDSFPSRVVVVAASGKDDALLASSKRGALVDIAAPGEAVLAMRVDGTLGTGNATSAATALVAGAAGLLFAFDPSLDAAHVKAHLVGGARDGGRVAGDYPILNAYAALQRAAQRDGAPLCGQRVWYDGSGLAIERDSASGRIESVPLALGTDETVRFVVPIDGGREVFFYHQDETTSEWAVGRATLGGDEQWTVTPDATEAWESMSGSQGRFRLTATRALGWGGTTRAGDSTVWIEPTYASSPTPQRVPWSSTVTGDGPLGALSVWMASGVDDAPGQGRLLASLPLGPWAPTTAVSVTAVFDGPGDRVYVAVSAEGDSSGARLFRLSTASDSTRSEVLAFPAARDVSHLASSEDGRQLAVTFSPAPNQCAIEYRDTRHFDRVLRAIALPYSACASSAAAPNFAATRARRR